MKSLKEIVRYAFSPAAPFRLRNASTESDRMNLNDPETWRSTWGDYYGTEAGVDITHAGSLSIPAVLQCVATISGDCAVATLNVHKRNNDDPEIDYEHPVQHLISTRWNDETSAFEGWQRIEAHACIWGNGYAWIEREGGRRTGRPAGLYNMLPDRTMPKRNPRTGEIYYVSEINGKEEVFFKEEILHIKGLSLDVGLGVDVTKAVKETYALALAALSFNSKFFKNGAQAGGILEIPTTMGKKSADNLEEGFRKRYGKDSWFKTIILRDGAKFHQVTVDAERSQMHLVREDQVREIARVFRIPSSKLGLPGSVSYNSQEQDQLVYLNSTLNHHFASTEGECELKLLTEQESRKRTHYIEHNKSKLVEMDQKTLNEVLNIQRAAMVINANEWRRKINLPKRKDPEGDTYVNPNTTDDDPTDDEGAKKKEAKPAKKKSKSAIEKIVLNDFGRYKRRLAHDIRSNKELKVMQLWDEIVKDAILAYADSTDQDGELLSSVMLNTFVTQLEDAKQSDTDVVLWLTNSTTEIPNATVAD